MPESDTNKMLRERVKPDAWSEEELDSLWIGLRRYGRAKWQHEQPKIFESASKLLKPANEQGLSAEMMVRASCGARVSSLGMELPSCGSTSHPIGIQLGFKDHDPALLPPLMDPFSEVNADKKHMPGSSSSCDVGYSQGNSASGGAQESASFSPRGSTGKGPSDSSAAGSVKLNKLPHWMQNAFRQPPPPPPHVPAGCSPPHRLHQHQ